VNKLITTIVFLLASFSCSYAENTSITADAALEIASKQATVLEIQFNKMDIVISKDSPPWFFNYPHEDVVKSGYAKTNKEELKGYQYWAVYAKPKGAIEGKGDFCFFINRNNGEILEIYKGAK
jgi:hypothetical protein